MALTDAAVTKARSDANASDDVKTTRESFEIGIQTAANKGETSTIFEKKYFKLTLILAEIEAAGYDVIDNGSTWTVDWSNA